MPIESGSRGKFRLNPVFESNRQEKRQPLSVAPVPQTDTGGWVEYTKAKE